ncbi:formylglycine-generating enzyme family protein [Bradyrhizobium sp. ma5]|uniref:formylglycine-generating enzyme family protein n=1 Tax=Bradyrhizobium sp. ma5 TaxID=3344828 RepID=UPI0035D3E3F6
MTGTDPYAKLLAKMFARSGVTIVHVVLCIILIVFFITFDGSAGTAKAAETLKECWVCPTMVVLPRGSFLMGTKEPESKTSAGSDAANRQDKNDELPDEHGGDEQPQHKVEFKRPFAIGQYAVTRGEFGAFVNETGYHPAECASFSSEDVHKIDVSGINWRNPGFAQTDRDPAVCVSYGDAKKYAAWLSTKTGKPYRLPTEAEWEYAARAGTKAPRYWAGKPADVCGHANVLDRSAAKQFKGTGDYDEVFVGCSDGHIFTAPSGSYPPNAFGLYDMLGNVWQWVEDCYIGSYDNAPADGRAVKTDKRDGGCEQRVLRGGSWASNTSKARSAYRHADRLPNIYYGFRVARPL